MVHAWKLANAAKMKSFREFIDFKCARFPIAQKAIKDLDYQLYQSTHNPVLDLREALTVWSKIVTPLLEEYDRRLHLGIKKSEVSVKASEVEALCNQSMPLYKLSSTAIGCGFRLVNFTSQLWIFSACRRTLLDRDPEISPMRALIDGLPDEYFTNGYHADLLCHDVQAFKRGARSFALCPEYCSTVVVKNGVSYPKDWLLVDMSKPSTVKNAIQVISSKLVKQTA